MPSIPKIDIRPDHWEIVRDILQRNVPQYEVWAFGSRAKWTAKQYSDLDLAIITDQPLSLTTSANLSDDFSESDLPWKVDVVDWASTQENFRKIIEKDKVVVQKGECWVMGSEDYCKIGDVAIVFDGPHATPEKIEEGPYFLSISSLENGALDLSKSARLSEEQFVKWTKRVTPQAGDVLFSYETRIGDAALMPSGVRACLGRRMGLLRPDLNKVVPEYLLYAYLSPEFQQEIKKRTIHGATVDRIALKELPDFNIRIPNIYEQKGVVKILQSLDNKITLNRQLNQTLEQMAQALFKSWFVDFDPVIDNALAVGNAIPDDLQDRAERRQLQLAKADHKPLPENIRKLFPSEFELTESLGWVPKGWVISRLGDKVSVKRGGSPRPIQDFLSSEGLPWTKISDATASNTRFIKSTSQHIKPEGLSKTTLLKKGTLILSNSATPGLPKFLDLDACIHDGWLHFPEKEIISDLYLYQLFLVIREELIQQGNGSIFTNLKTDILKDHSMVIPSKAALDQFDKLMSGFHSKIYKLSESTAALEQLRDTLLPKLISGELRIPEVHAQLEEALA